MSPDCGGRPECSPRAARPLRCQGVPEAERIRQQGSLPSLERFVSPAAAARGAASGHRRLCSRSLSDRDLAHQLDVHGWRLPLRASPARIARRTRSSSPRSSPPSAQRSRCTHWPSPTPGRREPAARGRGRAPRSRTRGRGSMWTRGRPGGARRDAPTDRGGSSSPTEHRMTGPCTPAGSTRRGPASSPLWTASALAKVLSRRNVTPHAPRPSTPAQLRGDTSPRVLPGSPDARSAAPHHQPNGRTAGRRTRPAGPKPEGLHVSRFHLRREGPLLLAPRHHSRHPPPRRSATDPLEVVKPQEIARKVNRRLEPGIMSVLRGTEAPSVSTSVTPRSTSRSSRPCDLVA